MAEEFDIVRAQNLPAASNVSESDMLLVVQGGMLKRVPPTLMKGKKGDPGPGAFLGVTATYIVWKQGANGSWNNLLEIEKLRGPKGEKPEFRKVNGCLMMKYEGQPDSALVNIFDREELKMKFSDLTPAEVNLLKLHFSDLTEEDIAKLQEPAILAAAVSKKQNEAITLIEDARALAEQNRVDTEKARALAEQFRVKTEEARVLAENARAAEEQKRVDIEELRDQAEQARALAEQSRSEAESARILAEDSRVKAEESRMLAESARAEAEAFRSEAEAARIGEEKTRADAEILRNQSETKRAESEILRTESETLRAAEETDRDNAEQERIAKETERIEAERLRALTETNRQTKESERIVEEQLRKTAETERKAAETIRQAKEEERELNTVQAILNAEEATGKANTATDRADAAAINAENIVKGFQSDWNVIDSANPNYIRNKPEIPTLSIVPGSDTLSYVNSIGTTINFRVGDEVRVLVDGEYVFYKLYDLNKGVASWSESGSGTALPGNIYLQGANYYNESITIIKEGYINE